MSTAPTRASRPASEAGALWALGFRPFFLGAAVFAVVSAVWWAGVYLLPLPLDAGRLLPAQWHAHEMILGYAMAVVAGFLLTAVNNWTGIPTLRGHALMGPFLLWVLARMLLLFGARFLPLAALADLLFAVFLWIAIVRPVVARRQWRQGVILGIVLMLALANAGFYLGAAGYLAAGARFGIDLGLYLVVALILILGGRVMPFFIERGVGYPVSLRRSGRADALVLILFAAFAAAALALPGAKLPAYIAFCVFVVNSRRLAGWHTGGIWRVPLLWSLYLSLWLVNVGFGLAALAPWAGISPLLVVHCFAYGGIGGTTLSMMARVSLGHTGRDIATPPPAVRVCFLLVLAGAAFRVGAPLVAPDQYLVWVGLSFAFWVGAFGLFVVLFAPILVSARADGREG